MVGEIHGTRVPPEVSASSSAIAAAIISVGAEEIELVLAIVARQPLHRAG